MTLEIGRAEAGIRRSDPESDQDDGKGAVMTSAPEEPAAPDTAEPAEPPDPVHEPDDEPRFAPGGENDTPEVPMPDTEENES